MDGIRETLVSQRGPKAKTVPESPGAQIVEKTAGIEEITQTATRSILEDFV